VRSTSPSPWPTKRPQEAAALRSWQQSPQQLRPRMAPPANLCRMRDDSPTTTTLRQDRRRTPLSLYFLGSRRSTPRGFVCTRTHVTPRHHPRTQPRRRTQHPVMRHQVPPGSRHQHQQPIDQHLGRNHHRRRAVLPLLLERTRSRRRCVGPAWTPRALQKEGGSRATFSRPCRRRGRRLHRIVGHVTWPGPA
jgi:hypothetical protein